jgi:hypothetical protein
VAASVLCGGVVPNYRCGAVPDWPRGVTGFPFNPAGSKPAGTDDHKIVGSSLMVNTKYGDSS